MKIQKLLCVLILTFASQLSQAGDASFYIGTAIGRSAIFFDSQDFGSGSPSNAFERTTVGDDTGYKLWIGYVFNENWALEGGYARQGKFQFRSTTVDSLDSVFDYTASSWFLAGKLSTTVTGRFSIFGKLGMTQNTAQVNYWQDLSHVQPLPLAPGAAVSTPLLTTLIGPGVYSETVVAPLLGVGMEYGFAKDTKVRLEYENYGRFGRQSTTGRSTNTMTSLGIIYSF